jgi:2-oxoglutarate ferredoxin oxidoreductase subunit beta
VARSFSGDEQPLVPILTAGIAHESFAIVDVVSRCVSFTGHEGSTMSRAFTREHDVEAVRTGFVPLRREVTVPETSTGLVFMDEGGHDMHDMMRTVPTPLIDLPFESLVPGKAALDKLMDRNR